MTGDNRAASGDHHLARIGSEARKVTITGRRRRSRASL
jgi:hypothetical protein